MRLARLRLTARCSPPPLHPPCRSSRVCSCALWILGEYSEDADQIDASIDVIKQGLGPTPLLAEPTGGAQCWQAPLCACACAADCVDLLHAVCCSACLAVTSFVPPATP